MKAMSSRCVRLAPKGVCIRGVRRTVYGFGGSRDNTERIITMANDELNLTEEQKRAYARLEKNWNKVSKPHLAIGGGGCVMVECFYSDDRGGTSSHSMWIGIELDGYSHS
jgi:hypothetical protein